MGLSRKPAPPSTTATPASPRSTRAPPPFQANDLVGRKMAREGGVTAKALITTMRAFCQSWRNRPGLHLKASHKRLIEALMPVERAVEFNLANFNQNVPPASRAPVPMVKLFGIVCGGWQLARVALAAEQRINAGSDDRAFLEAKIATMRYFADTMIPGGDCRCRRSSSTARRVRWRWRAAFSLPSSGNARHDPASLRTVERVDHAAHPAGRDGPSLRAEAGGSRQQRAQVRRVPETQSKWPDSGAGRRRSCALRNSGDLPLPHRQISAVQSGPGRRALR